jgi:hypothetical protein
MFQTVRHWWSGGRGKITLRLFAFEFLVVVAGVLVAQALANYAQDRAAVAQMEAERSRVRYELQTVHSMFRSWNVAVPCLNDRMTEVMSGKPLSSQDLHRPSMPTPNFAPPDSFTLNLIAQHYGVAEKNRLKSVADNVITHAARDDLIVTAWGRLMLVDPANGAISEADRQQARIAAAEIKGYLRSMEVITRYGLETLAKLKVQARNNDEPGTGPAKTCAAIWKSGRIDPPLTTR